MRGGFFLALLLCASQVCAEGVSTERGQVYRTIGARALRLDVYRPRDAGPHPAVVLIHGGSWDSGDRRTLGPLARNLAERGFVAFAIEYRLAGEARFPAAVEDARAAVRWVGQNARRFGGDPGAIGVFGPSAGGHLALMAAALDPDLVRACATWAAPTDFVRGMTEGDRVPRESRRVAEQFLGGSFEALPRRWALASPATHVTRATGPLFLAHGDRDGVVPFSQARYMQEAAERHGVDVTLVRVRGANHEFRGRELWERVVAFLAARLQRYGNS